MGAMRLDEYLTAEGLSQTAMADRLGVSPSLVTAWLKHLEGCGREEGARRPGFPMAQRIRALTDGAVTLDDWPDEPDGAAARPRPPIIEAADTS